MPKINDSRFSPELTLLAGNRKGKRDRSGFRQAREDLGADHVLHPVLDRYPAFGMKGKSHVTQGCDQNGLAYDFYLHVWFLEDGKQYLGEGCKQKPGIEKQFEVFIAFYVQRPLDAGRPQRLTVDVSVEGGVFHRTAEGVGIVEKGPDPKRDIFLVDV